ncbi:MAG: nucleotidyltransferase domain-containing protein [Blastocatellia bacterium]
MSKQATTLKTASQASASANGRPQSRAAKAAEIERLAAEQFWAAYREWHETANSLPKRRAYIRRMCRRIAEEFNPEKIILFGSYAYGKPTMESDVDLLVVMEFEGGHFHQSHKITQRLSLALPLDLLVYTPEQLQYRLEIGDRFIREIIEQGKVMYEATNATASTIQAAAPV